MKRWMLRQFYKCFRYDGLLCKQHVHGKFRVKYNDGKVSLPFDYSTAKEYAELFGGKVIDNF